MFIPGASTPFHVNVTAPSEATLVVDVSNSITGCGDVATVNEALAAPAS
jgi:hypothetical protein